MDAGERHWATLGRWVGVLSNVEKMLEDGWKFYLFIIYLSFFGQ
jgi:hypothetical protein